MHGQQPQGLCEPPLNRHETLDSLLPSHDALELILACLSLCIWLSCFVNAPFFLSATLVHVALFPVCGVVCLGGNQPPVPH